MSIHISEWRDSFSVLSVLSAGFAVPEETFQLGYLCNEKLATIRTAVAGQRNWRANVVGEIEIMEIPKNNFYANRFLPGDVDVEDFRFVEVVGHAQSALGGDAACFSSDPTFERTFAKFWEVTAVESR